MTDNTELIREMRVESAYQDVKRSTGVAWALWFFTGGLGGHRFYLGQTGIGILMFFTAWMTLGIWPLIDAFLLSKMITARNDELKRQMYQAYGMA